MDESDSQGLEREQTESPRELAERLMVSETEDMRQLRLSAAELVGQPEAVLERRKEYQAGMESIGEGNDIVLARMLGSALIFLLANELDFYKECMNGENGVLDWIYQMCGEESTTYRKMIEYYRSSVD